MGTSIPLLDARRFDRGRAGRAQGRHHGVGVPARPQRGAHRRRRSWRPSAPELVEQVRLVDELIVVDDHSTDAHRARSPATPGRPWSTPPPSSPTTARATARARRCGSRSTCRRGDLVVWCDTDIIDFDPQLRHRPARPAASRTPASPSPRASTSGPSATASAAAGSPSSPPGPCSSCSSPTSPASSSRCRASTPAGARCSSGCRSRSATASTSACSIDVRRLVGPEAMVQVDLGQRDHRNRTLRRARARRPSRCCRRASSGPGVDVAAEAAELPPLVDVPEYRDRAPFRS